MLVKVLAEGEGGNGDVGASERSRPKENLLRNVSLAKCDGRARELLDMLSCANALFCLKNKSRGLAKSNETLTTRLLESRRSAN